QPHLVGARCPQSRKPRPAALRYWTIVGQSHYPPRRDVAGLCASLPTLSPRTAAKMAENPRLSLDRGHIRRETDCPLERDGFEPSVPRRKRRGAYRRYKDLLVRRGPPQRRYDFY